MIRDTSNSKIVYTLFENRGRVEEKKKKQKTKQNYCTEMTISFVWLALYERKGESRSADCRA